MHASGKVTKSESDMVDPERQTDTSIGALIVCNVTRKWAGPGQKTKTKDRP